jgi:uncharacterized protein (DUF1015 family)
LFESSFLPELRPFRGLRYDPAVAGDPSTLLAPPFDVIDAAEQRALHERSPYNVVRLELGEDRPDDTPERNRYTRAAETLAGWRRSGVLVQEDDEALYVYRHEFEHEGRSRTRTALLARLRLEPWEAGAVRPHEETMAKPKEDRLELMRHLHANISPVFLTMRAGPGERDRVLPPAGEQVFEARMADGQRHRLNIVRAPEAIRAILDGAIGREPLYVLDGHHRYETALAYRDERRAKAAAWTGEEPENFVLAAITTANDPGLLLLPIHRLVRPRRLPPDVVERLARYFNVDDVTPKSWDGTALLRLLARVRAAAAARTAIGALGLEEGHLHLLTLRDGAAVRALMPDRSEVWQSLDANVLEYAVLRDALGLERGAAPDEVSYTEDASLALREVEAGRWPLAFLLNPTRIEQVLAVADAGERMPAKSTFFYPKLATGLVINAFE